LLARAIRAVKDGTCSPERGRTGVYPVIGVSGVVDQ
jgi:hypothetical protein